MTAPDDSSTAAPDAAPGPAWIPAPLRAVFALPNDHPRKTLAVAVSLCLVCSIVVAASAVLLKPVQQANQTLDRKKNILAVAGVYDPGASVDAAFARFEARAVDLDSGQFTDAVDPLAWDQRRAAADPATSTALTADGDIAGIGRRANIATVYLLRDGDAVRQIILPVHGYGLWSTLYGFVSIEGDLNTVAGIRFYEHAETPGLGGEVDNPAWRDKWRGKAVFGEDGEVRLAVVKGRVDAARPEAKYQVDGLAGATLTSRGVHNLVQFWLGPQGFGPFIAKLKEDRA